MIITRAKIMVERRLAIIGIMAALCIQLANGEPVAEYGPVYEKDICKADYIKTTDCNTIELDIFNDEYCCKKCPNLQQNPDPEHSNSCSYITKQPTTMLKTTTVKPSTTASQRETTTTDRKTAPYLDDPTTTAVSIPQKITTEQDTKDDIDPPLVTATKLPGATIAWIVASVIICMIIAALAVYCYCKKKRQNTAIEDKPLPVDEENPLVPDPQQADEQ
uniref:uncharacterized protein LOC120328600 n=1 Tax=Styela clava TaxID=7725 RepID=UPI00193A1EB4|nr:uncharacterized protein LOC120328600 [Styela clava]